MTATDPNTLMEQIKPRVEEARVLRELSPWDLDDPPMVLHAHLIEVRARYDRVEAILATLIEYRTRTRALLNEAREAHEALWDAKATGRKADALEYMAGRERVAHVNVDVIPQRRRLRALERVELVIDGAVESVKLIHRGLDTVRRDLDTRIRLLMLEDRLER